jgi:drug/metabolite transporter (DMT)-like permease
MHTRVRRIQVAAVLIAVSGVSALVAVPDTLSPVIYAAVATVLMALAMIVRRTYTGADGTRTLGQLVAASDAGMSERHDLRRRT